MGADGVQCVWIRIPRTVDQFTLCISVALCGFQSAQMRLDLSGWTCTGFRGSGRFSLGMDGFHVLQLGPSPKPNLWTKAEH